MEYTEWFDPKHTGKVCEKFLSWTDMNDLETLSFRIDVEVVEVERYEEAEDVDADSGSGALSILGSIPRKMSNSQSQSQSAAAAQFPLASAQSQSHSVKRPKTPVRRKGSPSGSEQAHFLEISDPAQILLLLTSATAKNAESRTKAMDGIEEMAEAKVSGDDMFRINGVLQQRLDDEVEEQLDALNAMVDTLQSVNDGMSEELEALRAANADYALREEREQVMAHQIELLHSELAAVREKYSDSAAENGKLMKKLYETKMSVQVEREKQCELEMEEALQHRHQLDAAKQELTKLRRRNVQV